jgi:hypothetical protein
MRGVGSNLDPRLSAFAVSYGLTRKRLSGDRNRRKEKREKSKEERVKGRDQGLGTMGKLSICMD